ncbi:hypothetical protein H4W33_006461 [Kibdelosporangium phytohabitans]|uniref:Uncharacterized protein n=1 Tax=Kibdelosporangium phytohabitans TaxID=860235 RepID=A0A0N9HPC7_9PSEU|nr:hypothetical protein [Kibdelosporangium phytohabitans]ALG06321.1 hypothetical protein AOZ06_04735 [Kibdelosporangium phytohabitans]MBE1467449.1 hypothetical protein [Kibdelosporangium phytohabitans]
MSKDPYDDVVIAAFDDSARWQLGGELLQIGSGLLGESMELLGTVATPIAGGLIPREQQRAVLLGGHVPLDHDGGGDRSSGANADERSAAAAGPVRVVAVAVAHCGELDGFGAENVVEVAAAGSLGGVRGDQQSHSVCPSGCRQPRWVAAVREFRHWSSRGT